MAALGKILRKGQGGNGFNSVKYEPLNQDPADNEAEDDDVVFVRDGKGNGAVSTNGATPSNPEIQELRNSMHENIEVGDLGLQTAKVSRRKPPNDVEVKVMKQGMLTRTRIGCFVGSILALVTCVVMFVMVIPHLSEPKILVFHTPHNQTKDWTVRMDNYGTESCVRLLDIDGDGIDDIMFGAAASWILDSPSLHREQMKQLCRDTNLPFPCVGKIVALRGYDGKKLWELATYMEVFEINCGNIDIDKDGKMDCIGSGRMSTVVAFDPRKGTVLWEGDVSVLKDTWNTYNVVILPDFTGDGVPEVLLPHGGEPSFGPTEKDRYPGRLIVLDGATGMSAGRYLEMPEKKETYSSPVLHTKKDGAQYVLFGHGGETVVGSLLAISVPDLFRHVYEMPTNAKVPNTRGNYTDWEQKLKRLPEKNGNILEIFRGTSKGVMVPPVLIEMTGDKTKDILMSAYDSVFILYDGETLKPLWKKTFPGYETYSSPAPGYFTADDTMDFMLHISKGAWPHYTYSLSIILDGENGNVIWSFNTSKYEMTSDLVARTMTRNPPRDAFVFRVMGRDDNDKVAKDVDGGEELSHGVVKQDGDPQRIPAAGRKKRQAGQGYGRRKSLKWPPTTPPAPYRSYQPKQQPPGYPNYNRPLPSEQEAYQRKYSNSPQYSEPVPQYSPQYSQHSSPKYRPSEYYDETAGNLGADVDVDDDREGEAYYNLAPEYAGNGGLIVGGGRDEQDTGATGEMNINLHDGEEVETIIFPEYESECHKEKKVRTSEIFVMDRSALTAPIRVVAMDDYNLNYNLTTEDRNKADDILTENLKGRRRSPAVRKVLGELPKKKDPLCTRMRIQEVNTGALGDVDGDGMLDMVAIFNSQGSILDERRVFIHNHFQTQVVKINLDNVLSNGESVELKAQVSHFLHEQQEAETQTLRQMRFSVLHQPWAQYLGATMDSVYRDDDKH